MIYVISDLHGVALPVLQDLLNRAGFSQEDTLFVLGDTIDRGEHGVERLLWMMEQVNVIHLLGNHEAMLLAAADTLFAAVTEENLSRITPETLGVISTMQLNGAAPTLKALRALAREEPEQLEMLLDYLRDLPLWDSVEVGERTYLFVHAGLGGFSPEKKLSAYTDEELLWHRPALSEEYFGDGITVVFGHTPTGYYGKRGEIVTTDTWCCIDTSDTAPTLLRLDDWAVFQAETT